MRVRLICALEFSHDAPRWEIELSRSLLLERGTLYRRLFVLRHHCCSSAATSRVNQWRIGGYTRVYSVYQPPGFF